MKIIKSHKWEFVYAQQAILSGYSTGVLASIMHCDEFTILLPSSTNVKCLSDVGAGCFASYFHNGQISTREALDFVRLYKKSGTRFKEIQWPLKDVVNTIISNLSDVVRGSYDTRILSCRMCSKVSLITLLAFLGLLSMEKIVPAVLNMIIIRSSVNILASLTSLIYLNLEDKVLIEGGSIIVNSLMGLEDVLSNNMRWSPSIKRPNSRMTWDPGPCCNCLKRARLQQQWVIENVKMPKGKVCIFSSPVLLSLLTLLPKLSL